MLIYAFLCIRICVCICAHVYIWIYICIYIYFILHTGASTYIQPVYVGAHIERRILIEAHISTSAFRGCPYLKVPANNILRRPLGQHHPLAWHQ